jgi:zinc transporter 2
MVHVIGDLVQTVGVLIASIFIWLSPKWWWLDPICTYLFSILVVATTLPILKESSLILMEATPVGINPEEVDDTLRGIPGVFDTHDLHIWSLGAGTTWTGHGKNALAVHVIAADGFNTCDIRHQAEDVLKAQYGIDHTTIQIEQCETLQCAQSGEECSQSLHTCSSKNLRPKSPHNSNRNSSKNV